MKFNSLYKISGAAAFLLSAVPVMAQEAAKELPAADFFSLNTDSLLMMFAIFLILPIYFLAKLLIFGVKINLDKKAKTLSVLAVLGLFGTSTAHASAFGQFNYVTWTLFIVILIELLVIAILAYHATKLLNWFTAAETTAEAAVEKPGLAYTIWQKLNKFRPMEEEGDLDIGHEYDGIKELDNVTPPWFTMGFAASIVFAIIYLWVYHVSESAPLQDEEFRIEMTVAQAKLDEYLKTQANQVDENTVTLLTDAGSIANGKKLFEANCVACHKSDGGGSIGPNLTDEYWLHGGSVKDVFSTIKYGVLDKGMVPWKDEMSPNQIAQLVAYIHTLKGTNPPGAKVAEGEIYSEGAESAEASVDASVESTVVAE